MLPSTTKAWYALLEETAARRSATLQPLKASINLSTTIPQTTPPTENFQSEISTLVSVNGQIYTYSSGGGPTLQITRSSNPGVSPLQLLQRLSYGAAPTAFSPSQSNWVSQSVASYGTLLAVALSPADYSTQGGLGIVRFYRVGANGLLTFLNDVTVGYLPDGIAFNSTGTQLVVANEGEPTVDYKINGVDVDRPGTIGIITITNPATTPSFSYTELGFAGLTLPAGVRVGGKAGVSTQATDLEPEFVSINGLYAYVTLQENNAVAKVNLRTRTIERIFALGSVDFSRMLVDINDRDNAAGNGPLIKPVIGNNVQGQRMADGIAAFTLTAPGSFARGTDYFLTSNEGDGRDYGSYNDEVRRNTGLSSRLKTLADVTTTPYAAFGSRSISLFEANNGSLVWDSGNSFQTLAIAAGVYDDLRSDDKGTEPESVAVARVEGRTYAIAALERTTTSMLVVFDITNPAAVAFVTSRTLPGSVSPEGLAVLEANRSPNGRPMLTVSNELSNTLDYLDLADLVRSVGVASAGAFTPTMLKDVVGGDTLQISSLITMGEVTNGLTPGSPVYAPPGIPDGQGAYDNGDGTYTLLVNHELGAANGYGYVLPNVSGGFTGARVSSLIISKDVDRNAANGLQSRVLAAGLAYDAIYLDGSTTPIDEVSDLGAAGFKRFCAANLVEANSFGVGRGFADRTYLVGEEEFAGDGGSFFALDVNNRAIHEVVGFGKGTWESATSIDTGSSNTVAVLLFDDAKAPLYLWLGSKSTAPGASYLERNGMAANQGSLYAFVPTALAENGVSPGPDSSDLNAFTQLNGLNVGISGSWVNLASLNPNYTQLGAPALRQLAVNAGALQLSRIEDGEVNPLNGKQAVFVSTGTTDFSNGDLYGNVYTLDFSSAFTAAGQLSSTGNTVLKVVYDADQLADPTTGLRNPDNMTISANGFAYIQEDRANGGGTNISSGQFGTAEASIWKLEIDEVTGSAIGGPTRWAQIDRNSVPTVYGQTDANPVTSPTDTDIGNWESSGIIDVSAIYSAPAGSYFLANIQAHSIKDGNIIGSHYLAESGQIDLIRVLP
ncbi:MAG: alkaline phosphatase PhoX [Synechococcaceae cyanobacterium]|nr:alkaline phosphatase PhoX [Synechococcaceae cyanobacterium]